MAPNAGVSQGSGTARHCLRAAAPNQALRGKRGQPRLFTLMRQRWGLFFRAPSHKEDIVFLAPAAAKISTDRQDRRYREENPGEDGHTYDSRCTLEQLATARVPHLGWLALQDHCFTAAETAKRTQKQVCPHAPRSGAKCCGRDACREAQGGPLHARVV